MPSTVWLSTIAGKRAGHIGHRLGEIDEMLGELRRPDDIRPVDVDIGVLGGQPQAVLRRTGRWSRAAWSRFPPCVLNDPEDVELATEFLDVVADRNADVDGQPGG
ncbi:MAG: hypothetical protein R3C97_14640 [Geminicoccaceae bacterium]